MGHFNNISEKGYTVCKAPKPRLLQAKKVAWEELLRLPEKVRKDILYCALLDTGYEIKQKGESFDVKQNFHLLLNDYPRLKRITQNLEGYCTDRINTYLDVSEEMMYENYLPIAKEVIAELEPYFLAEISHLLDFIVSYWIQRDLSYNPIHDLNIDLAKAHIDIDLLTFGSTASCGGLELFSKNNREWRKMVLKYGEIFIMPGAQCQILSESKITASWHKVKNTQNAIRDNRLSSILFSFLPGFPMGKSKITTEVDVGYNFGDHESFLAIQDLTPTLVESALARISS